MQADVRETADARDAGADVVVSTQQRRFLSAVREALADLDISAVAAVAQEVETCLVSGRQVVLLGNGGSSATASQLATDLILAARAAGLSVRVTAVHESHALVTALANDVGFADSGTFFVNTGTAAGDVLLVFSGSGRSPNLVNAATVATGQGMVPILIGATSAPASFPAKHRVLVASDHYSVIEAVHSAVAHAVAGLFRRSLGPDTARCSETGHLEAVSAALGTVDDDAIASVAELLLERVLANRQVILMGNGGSCATASHFATDLLIAARAARLAIRVVAPHDSACAVTAVASDIGFAQSGAFFVESSASPGDVLVVFSAGDGSRNLVNAAWAAADRGVVPVLLGSVGTADDFPAAHRVLVQSDDCAVVEAVHSAVAHAVADLVRRRLGVGMARCSERKPAPASP